MWPAFARAHAKCILVNKVYKVLSPTFWAGDGKGEGEKLARGREICKARGDSNDDEGGLENARAYVCTCSHVCGRERSGAAA